MSYMIDLLILGLLASTLGYAYLVDRRVRKLMKVLREMEPMIGSFSQAVDRSESTVSALRAAREVAPLRKRPEPPRPEARAEAAPETSDPGAEPAFRSKREPAPRPADATPISGKSELIRGFFDTVRQREA